VKTQIASVRVAIAVLVTAIAVAWPAATQAQNGVVRIFNTAAIPVTIYSLQIDTFGYRQWKPIGQIPAHGVQEFPGVPAGAVFGAQASGGGRKWPPFTIVYAYGPIFEYRLF